MDDGLRGDLEFGTVPRLARIAAERHGAAEAIADVDAGVTLTFEQLRDAGMQAGSALAAAGVEPGDRVAIWAPNMWEWVVAGLGVHCAGGVIVPLNTRFKGAEAAHVLGKSRARVLFTVTGFLGNDYVDLLGRAVDIPTDLPALEHVVLFRGEHAGARTWDEFIASGTADISARADAVRPDDLSDMLFTSGTTGAPKGVMCTHSQNLRAYRDWADVVGLRAGDRYLIVNPFFHAFGYKAGWLASHMTGATIVPHAVFDPAAVLERIPRDRVSMLPGPPALFQQILARDDLGNYDLSTLRLAVTGAAAIPVSLVEEMRDRLGFETVITGYGLTEATGIATMCRHHDDPETIANTSGRAIPGVEVRVTDDTGREAPHGEAGEIVIRGYNVMLGYFEQDDETVETIDAQGWLHTGDIGTMDERGYIKITDRKKDMYIHGGFNAYPAEIEGLMARHPDIAQVAVIGVPDPTHGEVGWAYVVPRAGASIVPEELIAWCRAEMANYKVPRRVEVVDALPLNASGKVLKYELRERAQKAEL